jgi:hypothetical protein
MASTSVVLPWSTWAMIAMLRSSIGADSSGGGVGLSGDAAWHGAVAVAGPAVSHLHMAHGGPDGKPRGA